MAFNQNASNLFFTTKVKVKNAFEALKKSPVVEKRAVSPDQLPFDTTFETGHIQGVSISGEKIAVTTSSDSGHIMLGQAFSTGFVINGTTIKSGYNHPGGIQAIGKFLAVPIYDENSNSSVHIYDMDKANDPTSKPDHLITLENNGYCLGITTAVGKKDDGTEYHYYVLAVVIHNKGDPIQFYCSPPHQALGTKGCVFQKTKLWNSKNISNKSKWIDKNWTGYANNISLMADQKGNVYFVGAHNTSPTGIGGNDWADLYTVELDKTEDKMLTKIGKFKVPTTQKISFRWGANIVSTPDQKMQLIACEKRVGGDNNSIELNFIG